MERFDLRMNVQLSTCIKVLSILLTFRGSLNNVIAYSSAKNRALPSWSNRHDRFAGTDTAGFHKTVIYSSIKQDDTIMSETRNNFIDDRPSSENESSWPSSLNTSSSIHLVSFPHLSDNAPKLVRDIWKWKDIVLGDGRDYFVPRPRALSTLSDVIVGTALEGYKVEECAILSNCARLDVLLLLGRVEEMESRGNVSRPDDVAALIVAGCVYSQLGLFTSQRRSPFMESVSSFLDLPGMVFEDTNTRIDNSRLIVEEKNEELGNLALFLNRTSSAEDIVTHFSKVAAGMAPRASRPDRPVIFRPFSSRDAHIMLQLKRTSEVASQYPNMKIILDAALSAGKAARDTKQCPALNKLKGYDNEGKYSQAAPQKLANEVAEEVIELAIMPAVKRSLERLNAHKASDQIIILRQQAKDLYDADDIVSGQIVKKMLHGPCMELRQGKKVDVEEVLLAIKVKLNETVT